MNVVVQHVVAAADALLDEQPGLAEYHAARAELMAGRTGRTVSELVEEHPDLADIGVAPAVLELGKWSA